MPPGNRPKEVHTKHLTERERFRVRTLYYDACMSKKRIEEVTGYSSSQVRTAIRAQSAAVPPRSGRPKKGARNDQQQQPDTSPSLQGAQAGVGTASEDPAATPPSLSSYNDLSSISSMALAIPQPGHQSQLQHPVSPSPSFNSLPAELRRHIWELVLTSPPPPPTPTPSSISPSLSSSITPPPPQQPPSCYPFYLTPLPHPPHLLAAPHITYLAPYMHHRRCLARDLSAVNREARRAVLDTFTPVLSTSGVPVPFVWLDPRRDALYYKDGDDDDAAAAADLGALLDQARGAVLQHLVGGGSWTGAGIGSGGDVVGDGGNGA
ncbi:hypothetical protein GGR54DRAFT_636805 [Hypoxylon sp. NC1633]|nr:hypothetical protein GGR54DRAFT_636805 [Hypoxylon sp. NC1633]